MTDQTQRSDFTDLVRDRRAELGISLRDLEERSIDPGPPPTQAKFGWLSKVERGKPIDTPPLPLLRALSIGLRLPLPVLQEAVASQFLGMTAPVWSHDRSTRILAARIEEMTAEERRQLAEIAETFARRRALRSEDGEGKSGE
ncbi:XRE family transcriptional regulator [Streptomyces sp. NPDC048504]|uniref:XRE family transcriptional regulator n=1 Tax=Streptomyces sp. NPDC048504 TaxID=3365559 RepID=UPI003713738B